MIAKITAAYVRHYSDNGQTKAYVEWVDHKGQAGRTEADITGRPEDAVMSEVYGAHMGALMARAICNGIVIERQDW